MYTGSQVIVRLLENQGIRVVTGIPGGPILPVYDELAKSEARGGIRHILARHEQGAGFIAQGQARSSGRPAVLNLLTALADAQGDSVPIIAISGQVPHSLIGTQRRSAGNRRHRVLTSNRRMMKNCSPKQPR